MTGNGMRPNIAVVKAAPDIVTLPALMAKEFSPIRWTVPGILPEGVILFVGKSKMGKSWAAADLGLAVGFGGVAFGRLAVEAGPVLYLALEDSERRLKDRYAKLLMDSAPPNVIELATDWPRVDEGGLDEMEAWLTSHPTARLLIVDTLKKIRPQAKTGQSVYDRDYESLEGMQRLAGQHHCGILVIYHMRKAVADDPVDMVSGSGGLAAAADGLWIFERKRGENEATVYVTTREAEDQELALTWDPLLTTWTIAGDAEEYRLTKERQAIVDLLREQGESMSIREVAAALEKNYHTTRNLVRKMVADGMVYPVGTSHYQVASDQKLAEIAKQRSQRSQAVDSPHEDAKRPDYGVEIDRSQRVARCSQESLNLATADYGLATAFSGTVARQFPHGDAEKTLPDYGDPTVCIEDTSEEPPSLVPGFVEDLDEEPF